MDNRLGSQIKRGLKITTSYLLVMILFIVFALPVLSMAKEDNFAGATFAFSAAVFLFLFFSVYVEARNIAIKEKRPHYNINPSPLKGLLYGVIGIIPLVLVQIIVFLIQVPENFETIKRRVYQTICAPLYWLAKLIGDRPVHYVIVFAVIIFIAGLGYYAGYREFYLVETLRQKLGIRKPVKTGNKTHRK